MSVVNVNDDIDHLITFRFLFVSFTVNVVESLAAEGVRVVAVDVDTRKFLGFRSHSRIVAAAVL